MSACSAREEEEWRKQLDERISVEGVEALDGAHDANDMLALLSLNIKTLGNVYGQPESFARKISIRRALTLNPKAHQSQVIIKNTEARPNNTVSHSTASLPIARSQSLLSAANVPILSPRRSERAQLEHALSDVWTRDVLPYPGIGPKRIENPIRASATSVMRKLSMASIANSISKRSASISSAFTQPPRIASPSLRNRSTHLSESTLR